jgi:uridine kinase
MKTHIINVFGSSGSGSTTLASEIAKEFNYKFVDVDDYLWQKTDPPFTQRNTNSLACSLIKQQIQGDTPVVIAGSLVGIADELKSVIDLFIYINLDKSIRIKRIQEREYKRLGKRICPDGDLFDQHQSFLQWVSDYEDNPETKRSRRQHLLWLDDVDKTVLKITDELTLDELLKLVKPFIYKGV